MSVRLLSLQGIRDEEAMEIRSLLESNSIRFYETPRGNWGFSMAAIWLPDTEQLDEAKSVLAIYFNEQNKIYYQKKLEADAARTPFQRILYNPDVVGLYIPAVLIIILTIILLLYIR
jgi:hypothetical protein